MTPPKITKGLSSVLELYCRYRQWQSVSPETILQVRALIERVGTIEEVEQGLGWFFESKDADDYIIKARPNLPIEFIIKCWERYEIAAAEIESHAFIWPKQADFNEYSLIR